MRVPAHVCAVALTAIARAAPTSASADTMVCEFDGVTGALCSINNGPLEPSRTTSSGRYENDIGGTGRWFGENPANTTVTTPSRTVTDVTYRLDFVGGAGRLDVLSVERRFEQDPLGSSPVADGSVTITHQPGQGNCINQDVTQFQVRGAFSVTW